MDIPVAVRVSLFSSFKAGNDRGKGGLFELASVSGAQLAGSFDEPCWGSLSCWTERAQMQLKKLSIIKSTQSISRHTSLLFRDSFAT